MGGDDESPAEREAQNANDPTWKREQYATKAAYDAATPEYRALKRKGLARMFESAKKSHAAMRARKKKS